MAILRTDVAFDPDLLTGELSDDPQLFGDSAYFYNEGSPNNKKAFYVSGENVGGGFVDPVISAYGEKFAYDSSNEATTGNVPIKGTIDGLEFGAFIGPQYERGFTVMGLDLSAKEFAQVIGSESIKDDLSLVKSIFQGKDSLFGSKSDDILDGFKGKDVLVGADGDDTFRFSVTAKSSNVDNIDDFKHGGDADTMQFVSKIFDELEGGVKKSMFMLGTEAKTEDQHLIYDKASGDLFYDADGSGKGEAQLVAVLDNHATLKVGDFDVI